MKTDFRVSEEAMQTVENLTCPFCGTLCDDLEVVGDDGRIVDVKNACVLSVRHTNGWCRSGELVSLS